MAQRLPHLSPRRAGRGKVGEKPEHLPFYESIFAMTEDSRPALKPANENPWYLMATLYGEQTREKPDKALTEKNRRAWNYWVAFSDRIPKHTRQLLLPKVTRAAELSGTEELRGTGLEERFRARAQGAFEKVPELEPTIDLGNLDLAHLIDFSGYIFPIDVSFENALFRERAYFKNATFAGKAYFAQTKFDHDAIFYGARFFRYSEFLKSVFAKGAEFKGAEFQSHTKFAGSDFKSAPPDFSDAVLRQATEWHDITWPPPPKNCKEARSHVHAYECLKLEMQRLGKHEEEQNFFAMELRARRALLWFTAHEDDRRVGERLNALFRAGLNWSYSTFSGYGLSVSKPLFWLVMLVAVGTIGYMQTAALHDWPMDFWDALELSATNLISFLPYRPDKWVTVHLSTSAKWVGNAQSFFGLVLLFLLGLALRNRFRMK